LVDAKMDFVYGGDLQGNVWRIDMSTSPPALMHMATLKDGAGNPQPISVRPVVTNLNNKRIYYVGTGRYSRLYRSVGHLAAVHLRVQGQGCRLRNEHPRGEPGDADAHHRIEPNDHEQ